LRACAATVPISFSDVGGNALGEGYLEVEDFVLCVCGCSDAFGGWIDDVSVRKLGSFE
jgi:hypothetical protein